MKKLSAKQKVLYSKVAEILWEYWDPIGVNDGKHVWTDEYDSYVPDIFQKVVEGRGVNKIAKMLSNCVSQNMGFKADKDHDLKVACQIVQAKQTILD